MRVAVLSLTRDRLDYTKHCFQTLRDLAGCDYDHYVADNGSADGTPEWLEQQDDIEAVTLNENVGVNRALNLLLDEAFNPADYDVIVKFDNDCELLTPNTLRDISAIVGSREALMLSPRIHGLRNPPRTIQQYVFAEWTLDATEVIGGIFCAAPAWIFADGYRHNEDAPPWGDEDQRLCQWFREHGGYVGYLDGYDANHYRTTDGQHADFPDYFGRRIAEGGPE